jgi:valyl-tRNA synthetase
MQPHLAPSIEKATRRQFPNGIEPHGTDALRFTFAALATQSRDIRFDLGRVGGYRNFCNKLWNAARFVLMMTEGKAIAPAGSLPASEADRWIGSRLRAAIEGTEAGFRDYRFDFAATALYEFTWHEFCDWYLELSKPVLQGADEAAAALTRRTLLDTLEALLRALHPLMPFITDEIWRRVAPLGGVPGETVMLAPWPEAARWPRDEVAESAIAWLKGVVLGVRQVRGEMDVAPSRRLDLLVREASADDAALFASQSGLLERLAGLGTVRLLEPGDTAPPSAAAVVGGMTLLVPMAGLIEPAAELARLSKRLEKTRQEIARARAKLGNAAFVDNAPADVVATERERLAQFEQAAARLELQSATVREML